MLDDGTALLVVRTTWWDPQRAPTVQVVRAPLIDGRIVELDLALDLRTVDHVEVRPVRRPLLDVAGHVRDAERLANAPANEARSDAVIEHGEDEP